MPKRERYVWVCTNRRPDGHPKGSCAEQGSESLQREIKSAVAQAGLNHRVRVCASSCLDLCWKGISVAVMPDMTFLGGTTEADIPALIEALSQPESVAEHSALQHKVVKPEEFDDPGKGLVKLGGPEVWVIQLEFSERMRGSWHRLDAPAVEYPIEFNGRATVGRLSELLGNTVATLRGRVVAEGLTRGASFDGTLGLGALWREGRLPYAFSFPGDDGTRYRFDGAKEVSVLEPVRTMTVLSAYLFDDRGNEVGRTVLHFEISTDLAKFLRSWRLRFTRTARSHR